MPKVNGKKYNDLYPKERQFLQKIKSGKTPKEAAKEIYATNGNESAVANRVFRRRRFLEAYEKAGLTATALVKSIVGGVGADKQVLYRGSPVNIGPDWFVRLAFIKLILKAQGVLEEEKDRDEGAVIEPLIISAVKITNNTINLSQPEIVKGEVTNETGK